MIDIENPDALPPALLEGANLRGNEYGWRPESFPQALATAEAHRYACLGGQFNFDWLTAPARCTGWMRTLEIVRKRNRGTIIVAVRAEKFATDSIA